MSKYVRKWMPFSYNRLREEKGGEVPDRESRGKANPQSRGP
jgi:hypothetical protein